MIRYPALALSALILLVLAGSSGVAQTQVTRSPTRSIWNGVYNDAQARRGEELYARHCSRCHGQDLAGLPGELLRQAMPDVKALLSQRVLGDLDRTPELAGPIFYSHYDKRLLSDLVERIRISMPTDKPGILPRKDTVDVASYLLSFGGFPIGPTALSDRLEDQQEIRVLAYKP
jgi:mono/diheme cytochrome c family protein